LATPHPESGIRLLFFDDDGGDGVQKPVHLCGYDIPIVSVICSLLVNITVCVAVWMVVVPVSFSIQTTISSRPLTGISAGMYG